MTQFKLEPQEFANAYIQTLKANDVPGDNQDPNEFFDERRDFYFTEYVKACIKATEFTNDVKSELNKKDN